jgi:hypothetical protein
MSACAAGASGCVKRLQLPIVIRSRLVLLASTLALSLWVPHAWAQSITDPQGLDGAGDARFRAGGLAVDPRFFIRDVGVDTNVFNTASEPVQDFTATAGPEVRTWLRAGRIAATSATAVGWTYFQKSTRQRSVDVQQSGRVDVDLVRITPHVGGAFERTRRRPNDEVDLRVRQVRTRANAGVALHPGPRLMLDLNYEQRAFDFGDDQFGDAALAAALNRTEQEASLAAAWTLTPLTTFVVKAAHRTDTFEFASERDSRSVSVMPGLEFKPLALIAGTAYVGVRSFQPVRDGLPGFTGVTAAVDLRYVALDRTRVEVKLSRDIDYSFEAELPYFVSTGGQFQLMQALGGGFDVVGRAGGTRMAYQGFDGTLTAVEEGRVDHAWLAGVGVGRRLGSDIRVGVDVNHVTRRSTSASRRYSGVRAGGSVTYGF